LQACPTVPNTPSYAARCALLDEHHALSTRLYEIVSCMHALDNPARAAHRVFKEEAIKVRTAAADVLVRLRKHREEHGC
jgi:hypothetical protein